MVVRESTDKEFPEVMALLDSLDAREEIRDISESLATYGKYRQYPWYKIFVAHDGESVVGTFHLIILDNVGHGGKGVAVAENVVVRHDMRSRGIGKIMMSEAMAKAREMGCYKLMLSSNRIRTDAHRFYDNIGFKRHGISFEAELK